MCLYDVTRTYPHPKRGVRTGWKVFFQRLNGKLYSEWFGCNEPWTLGEWYEDLSSMAIVSTSGALYHPGFHVFTHERDAVMWQAGYHHLMVREVRYNLVVAVGSQQFIRRTEGINVWLPCVVARELYVCPKGGHHV